MEFSTTTSLALITDDPFAVTYQLLWQKEPVDGESLKKAVMSASKSRFFDIQSFTLEGETVTKPTILLILGWRPDLHPSSRMELEDAVRNLLSFDKPMHLVIVADNLDGPFAYCSYGVVNIEVQQERGIVRFALTYPLSN